jgi:hypothetical protein
MGTKKYLFTTSVAANEDESKRTTAYLSYCHQAERFRFWSISC